MKTSPTTSLYQLQPHTLIVHDSLLESGARLSLLREEETKRKNRSQEKKFQEELKVFLQKSLGKKYVVESGAHLFYRFQIDTRGELEPKDVKRPSRGHSAFETDIVIRKREEKIPRVVIELKFEGFGTHDLITYSSKAVRHKQVYPYLRYGFVVGGRKTFTTKFFTHNEGFDFAMAVDSLKHDGDILLKMLRNQLYNANKLIDVLEKTPAHFKAYEANIKILRTNKKSELLAEEFVEE